MRKKTRYTATFEESKNIVNERYLKMVLKDSTAKVLRKRTLGIIVTCCILIGFSFIIEAIAKSPSAKGIIIAKWPILWCLVALFSFAYYVYKLFCYRKRKILRSYLFNLTMSFIVSNLTILFHLFLLMIVNIVSGTLIFSIGYSLFYLLLIPAIILSQNRKTLESLYKTIPNENKILKFSKKFVSYSQKYGGVILILLFIVRRFFNVENNEKYDLIQQIAVILSPLIVLVPILFINAMRYELLQGYYLKKYIEQYREEVGISNEEWYG